MGTQTQQDKAGNKYEVKPQYEELSKHQSAGGNHRSVIIGARQPITARWRHSNPVVTTPTIALDFSDTTQQSASHNVAPNQTTKNRAQNTRNAHPKAHASRRTHAQTFLKSFEVQQLRVSTSSAIQLLKWVANERAKQGKFSATKISKNKGWMRRKYREEMSR
ncbi:GHMP kinase (ISS) [Dorcoceras hygrometricum]|uniref:GHMP kinase (ISS) n=1 Tax=Dorcoceras hygrometricum TaxID=472368 RepID=A0A2Z7DA66_9LAMI|nr:GHMP kinase (ISS) [Dorcoceras hygrometricum]